MKFLYLCTRNGQKLIHHQRLQWCRKNNGIIFGLLLWHFNHIIRGYFFILTPLITASPFVQRHCEHIDITHTS